jgi:hypothetical protein
MQREFSHVGEDCKWMDEFRPSHRGLESLVGVLLWVFIHEEDEAPVVNDYDFVDERGIRSKEKLPSVVDALALQLFVEPGKDPWTVMPGKKSPQLADQIRKHLSSKELWSLSVYCNLNCDLLPYNNKRVSEWYWSMPPNGYFRISLVYSEGGLIINGKRQTDQPVWIYLPVSHERGRVLVFDGLDEFDRPVSQCGYGTLW